MVQDAAWASLTGSLYGGVILVGFALELGASAFAIGALAAVPFLAQLAQLPAVALIERVRRRRAIALCAVGASRVLILSLALLPLLDPLATPRLAVLVGAQAAITLLGAVAGCAVNSWFHQFLSGQPLGELYSRRLFWSTVLGSLGALAAGNLVQHTGADARLAAYSACFAAAGVAGFIGMAALGRVPEPPLQPTGPHMPLASLLLTPLRDRNFRRLIVFMAWWNFAANLAAPFLTVYLLRQQGYGMGLVSSMWAASQVANALTLYAWGRISDRMSNKGILATALPAYFGCLVGLPLAAVPEQHVLTLPLVWLIHIVMGMASGGIGLATGNIGLKLAPQGKGTAYLASVSLAGATAAGIAALAGGGLADWFSTRDLSVEINWRTAVSSTGFVALRFEHWEFLFLIAFGLGLYVMHALSRVEESGAANEREVIRDFALETGRMFEQASSTVASSLAALFPLGRLFDRRRRARERTLQPGGP